MATSTARYRILGVEYAALQLATSTYVGGTTPVPGVVVEHKLHFINNVAFQVQSNNVAFEGDQQVVRKYFLNGVDIVAVCDTYDVRTVSEAFDKQEITAGLPTGITGRIYFGDTGETSGVKCGFVARINAENLTSQTIEQLRFVAPMCTLAVVDPPTLAYNAKAQLRLTFSTEKVETDISLTPLPSVPAGGCMWYLEHGTPA